MSTAKTIYQIKVTLIDSKPPIWRRFLVEDTVTLGKLHDILQIVMGWTNSHLHHFIIDDEFYGMPLDDDFGDIRTKDETRFKLNQRRTGHRRAGTCLETNIERRSFFERRIPAPARFYA